MLVFFLTSVRFCLKTAGVIKRYEVCKFFFWDLLVRCSLIFFHCAGLLGSQNVDPIIEKILAIVCGSWFFIGTASYQFEK